MPTGAVLLPQELSVLTVPEIETLIAPARSLGYTLRDVHTLPELKDTLVVFGIPDLCCHELAAAPTNRGCFRCETGRPIEQLE